MSSFIGRRCWGRKGEDLDRISGHPTTTTTTSTRNDSRPLCPTTSSLSSPQPFPLFRFCLSLSLSFALAEKRPFQPATLRRIPTEQHAAPAVAEFNMSEQQKLLCNFAAAAHRNLWVGGVYRQRVAGMWSGEVVLVELLPPERLAIFS